jgi:hypothetical protein
MSSETAIVLARPERKRILRELLNLPEPWPTAARTLYAEMISLEWRTRANTGAMTEFLRILKSWRSVS